MNLKKEWYLLFIGYVVTIIGLIGSVFTIFGLQANQKIGLGIVSGIGFGSIIVLNILLLKKIEEKKNKELTLERFIETSVKEANEINCMFSMGDLFVRIMDDVLRRNDLSQKKFKVNLILRGREDEFEHRALENIERLSKMSKQYGFDFDYKFVKWDYFMITGVCNNLEKASLNFYYRMEKRTQRVVDEYFFVEKNQDQKSEIMLECFKNAFKEMWEKGYKSDK